MALGTGAGLAAVALVFAAIVLRPRRGDGRLRRRGPDPASPASRQPFGGRILNRSPARLSAGELGARLAWPPQ